MSSRIAVIGFVALVALAGLVVVGAPMAGTPTPRVNSVQTTALASPTSSAIALAGRDADVAFWEARVAAGGGYESSLRFADALIERSRATGDLADLERASLALDALVSPPPGDAGLALRRGRIAHSLHDFPGARAAAAAALELDPLDPSALALAGDAALEMGDIEDADLAYARLAEAGRRPPILARFARRAWLGGDSVPAEELVAEALRGATLIGSGDEVAFYHFQLAEMLRARNDLGPAEEAYRAALDAQHDHMPSVGGLALVVAACGNEPDAIRLLEGATAQLPTLDLVAALGDLYARAGREADAEDQWALVERIGEIGRANGGVYDRSFVLFLADHDRDPDRAVELASGELEVRGDVYGHDALAWALFKSGRPAEADAEATAALSLGTPDARLHYHAGLIAEALGRLDDARRHLSFAAERRAALPPLQWAALDAALDRLER